MRIIFNNKGISLVVLIVVMLGVAIIGGGVATVMSSKQKSYPFALNSFKAYQIANAGIECAIAWVKDPNNLNKGSFTSANNLSNISFGEGGGTFSTVISGTSPYILTSTGTFNGVSRVVTLKKFKDYVLPGDINFDDPNVLSSGFIPIESQIGQTIVVNPTQGTISLGQGKQESFGAVWYRRPLHGKLSLNVL